MAGIPLDELLPRASCGRAGWGGGRYIARIVAGGLSGYSSPTVSVYGGGRPSTAPLRSTVGSCIVAFQRFCALVQYTAL